MFETKQQDVQQFDLHIGKEIKVSQRNSKKHKSEYNSLLLYFGYSNQIGLAIALPLVVGTLIGKYFDTRFATRPTLTVIGLVIGIIISILNFVHVIKKIIRQRTV